MEVFLEHGLAGVADRLDVGGHGDGGEHADDDHDDHQLHEGEALLATPDGLAGPGRGEGRRWGRGYHVLYLVPSRAVPLLLEWTSKTFWPPQESESASSWLERIPQSVSPVMGSLGMARRNL